MPDSPIATQFNLGSYLENKRRITDQALSDIIQSRCSGSRLCSAMQYTLMASGKRLRPVLCMAASEAVGQVTPAVINTACAIEMIHTYSLIHDDLPAMDDDELRRGKPTCHIQYDEPTAILTGDALLTLAFELMADMPDSDINSGVQLRVIRLIAGASGHNGMIEGQMRDIAAENSAVSLDDLKKIHHLKTGALIESAVISGAMLAGGSTETVSRLKIYAANIGLAFQVVDDILNVEGDAAKMGKATGTDASRNKSTYPGLLGMERSRQFAWELINNALHALDIFDIKAVPLSALAEYVIKRER